MRQLCRYIVLVFTLSALGQDSRSPKKLSDLSLQELMNVEVTSVSRKEQRLSQVPAAVYVINAEDIRRSGATSIPELLRMVPGLHVARFDGDKWAIASRGFNGPWSNKLLVLIDGRTAYSSLFSGVRWGEQDTLLENIERIEVIRGPGATVWGANAVNGVINIITRHARDTQGGLVTAGAGTEETGFAGVQYGGTAGKAYYRAYSKGFRRQGLFSATGDSEGGGWNAVRGGFRLDWDASDRTSLMLSGDLYRDRADQVLPAGTFFPPVSGDVADTSLSVGGNLLARWRHTTRRGSEVALQVYFDRARRDDLANPGGIDTYDVDFQHRLALASRHDLEWGVAARVISDYTLPSYRIRFLPQDRTQPLFSGFVQDVVTIVEGRLQATLGSKVEHNVFTGAEFQPSLQVLWSPNPRNSLWGSLARAVRTPSRSDRDSEVVFGTFAGPGGMPGVAMVSGNPEFRSEVLRAQEMGYRLQTKRFSVDLAAFYNVYHNLRDIDIGQPVFAALPAPPHLVVPVSLVSRLGGETHGLEAATSWNLRSNWKVFTGYSWLQMRLNARDVADPSEARRSEAESPQHQFQIRSYLDLPYNLNLDTMLYHVGTLRAAQGLGGHPGVPAYTRLDARIGWRPSRSLEFSVALANLSDPMHPEFISSEASVRSGEQVSRGVYGKMIWRF